MDLKDKSKKPKSSINYLEMQGFLKFDPDYIPTKDWNDVIGAKLVISPQKNSELKVTFFNKEQIKPFLKVVKKNDLITFKGYFGTQPDYDPVQKKVKTYIDKEGKEVQRMVVVPIATKIIKINNKPFNDYCAIKAVEEHLQNAGLNK